VQCKCKWRHSH